ncbi:hypothetical protein CHISP_2636 [Chitinispirillum alkaliphilum]|nr:hypothetical protein CHISP_2636 [Chitinispirillum alkaliphilum]
MKNESVVKDINQAIAAIDNVINDKVELEGVPKSQLFDFKKRLMEMKSILLGKDIPVDHKVFSMSRIIVDSWPLNVQISELVIKAEKNFLKVLKEDCK